MPLTSLRLNKGTLKAFLSSKYRGYVAHRMVQIFDFASGLDFNKYIDFIELLINFKQVTLQRLAFNIYDFDQDNFICELDLYTIFKTYEHDDDLFISAYSPDISKIEATINKKRTEKGQSNDEMKLKLREIDKRM